MDAINLLLRTWLIRTSDNPRSREMLSTLTSTSALALASPAVSTLVPLACQWLVEQAPHPWYYRRYPIPEDVRIRWCPTACWLHQQRLGSHHRATELAWVRLALVESQLQVRWTRMMSMSMLIQPVCSIYTIQQLNLKPVITIGSDHLWSYPLTHYFVSGRR